LTLRLPAGDFQAYLFDCDGTVADYMPLHFLAWRQCTRPVELRLSRRTLLRLGRTFGDPKSWLGLTPSMDFRCLWKRCCNYFRALPTLKAEVWEQIDLNYGRIPLAIVSGSHRDSVRVAQTNKWVQNRVRLWVQKPHNRAQNHPVEPN
jgi:hypothetical protein